MKRNLIGTPICYYYSCDRNSRTISLAPSPCSLTIRSVRFVRFVWFVRLDWEANKWNRTRANEIKWNRMKSNEIEWNRMKSKEKTRRSSSQEFEWDFRADAKNQTKTKPKCSKEIDWNWRALVSRERSGSCEKPVKPAKPHGHNLFCLP